VVTTEPQLAKRTESWPVKPSRGGLLGLAAAAALLIGAAAEVLWVTRQPPGLLMLAALVLGSIAAGAGVALGLSALGYFRLRYLFAPGVLLIRSGAPTESIALHEIDGIYGGQRAGQLRRVRGTSWPGYHVGVVRSRSLGTLRVFCTDLAEEALSVIVTSRRTVLLSPQDPAAFRRELIRRIEADDQAAGQAIAVEPARGGGLPHPLTVGTFATAFALLGAALLAILANFDALPETLTMPLHATGQTAQSGPSSDIYQLPLLGAGVVGVNLILALVMARRERAPRVLLSSTGCLVAAVILLATLRLLT
jgi:hypothetical protein